MEKKNIEIRGPLIFCEKAERGRFCRYKHCTDYKSDSVFIDDDIDVDCIHFGGIPMVFDYFKKHDRFKCLTCSAWVQYSLDFEKVENSTILCCLCQSDLNRKEEVDDF